MSSLMKFRYLRKSLTLPLTSILPKTTNIRSLSTSCDREQMHYDVITVGAGPAGLSAAIRLKQLSIEKGIDLSVCVVEKGAEVGAHILSGNVFEPRALNELFPDWKSLGAPLETEAGVDKFLILSENKSFDMPHMLLPPQLNNDGNYIISLSKLVRWLAAKAEELGVEVYPGFAADEVLYGSDGSVRGIATKDAGIGKDGAQRDSYTRGIELLGRQTLFAEGCRGSCSESVMKKFDLRAGKDEQTYGLGVKEVWQVPKESFKKGYIQHTYGWPLQNTVTSDVFGGTFLYHMEPDLVLVGMVVGLDYSNPYLNPYKEFQRWKHHPAIAPHLEGGECIAYGARTLNEGGFHAIPKLTFPGGALVGCSAGFLNSVKIKGSHTAMKSGMLAAEAVYAALTKDGQATVAAAGPDAIEEVYSQGGGNVEVPVYEAAVRSSWIADELRPIRNVHSAFHLPGGAATGMLHSALSCFVTKGREPWTLRNTTKDSDKTLPAKECAEIAYPKPDGKLSFDLLTNLQKSGTTHNDDQPAHLRVRPTMSDFPSSVSIKKFAGPEQRFCPAGVYEYSDPDEHGERKLIINAQNCVHCKCCSIKAPGEFIDWTVPEGGGGPAYTVM